MGCTDSKSTSTVESNGKARTLIDKAKDTTRDVTNSIEDTISNVSQKVESIIHDIIQKPSNPETERMQQIENEPTVEENETENENNLNKENLQLADNPIPVKLSLQIENPEVGDDKPLTPMPEDAKIPAHWPNMITESNVSDIPAKSSETVAKSTPLDPIKEEKRYTNITDEVRPVVLEILTIEIAEIPIMDENKTEQSTNTEFKDITDEEEDPENNEAK